MADASSILKDNVDKIFTGTGGLKAFLKRVSSSGDKEIDEWDPKSEEMLKTPTKTYLTIIPRIKSKGERDWLRGKIKEFCFMHEDRIKSNISKILNLEGAYEWGFVEEKVSGTGLNSFIIQGKPEGATSYRNGFKILFQSKGLTSGSTGKREDPHELMTACLIMKKMKVNVNSLNNKKDEVKFKEFKKIVDELYEISDKVKDGSGKEGFYTDPKTKNEPDLVNLAKAISVSNFVLDEIPNTATIDAVWQTGKVWDNEIKKFNVGPKTIKNYNSSDIIVKFTTKGRQGATHYWGLSLKKADMQKIEPTLLNKPIVGPRGFITKKLDQSDLNKIDKAKKNFFVEAIKIKTNSTNYKRKKIESYTLKEILKIADGLFTDKKEKSMMLTSKKPYPKNTYFEAIHNAFMKLDNDKQFFEEFLDTIFKINLQTYLEDTSFHFSLITGFGDYKQGKLLVDNPSEKEGRTVSEVFRQIFGDSDNTQFRINPNVTNSGDKPMAFEKDAGAAKLFYEMAIGPQGKEHSIVMLEVRYKGNLTSEPQFQVFMSMKKNGFSDLYKKYVNQKKLKRW